MVVYFKQYGSQRTGTNYLKRLMEINFENVIVFGSVLGWKHGMYETGNGYQHKCHSHEQWIEDKTKDDRDWETQSHSQNLSPLIF